MVVVPAVRKIVILFVTAFLVSSCGAPTRRPADVAGMFKREAELLRDVAARLCRQLAASAEAPSLSTVKLTASQCAGVDEHSQEFSKGGQLKFVQIKTDQMILDPDTPSNLNSDLAGGSPSERLLYVQTRGQLWLNKSMMQLAQKLMNNLGAPQTAGTSSLLQAINEAAATDPFVKMSFREVDAASVDIEAKKFTSRIEVSGSGLAKTRNVLVSKGMIYNDAIAVEIASEGAPSFEESLLNRMNAIVMIVPFGNDVYVDMTIDLRIHSLGVDRLVAEQLSASLGTSIRATLDAVMNLGDE